MVNDAFNLSWPNGIWAHSGGASQCRKTTISFNEGPQQPTSGKLDTMPEIPA